MPHCPSCNREIADDFGLMNCSFCGISVFVNMDGQVELPGAQAPVNTGHGAQTPVDTSQGVDNDYMEPAGETNPPPISEGLSFINSDGQSVESPLPENQLGDYPSSENQINDYPSSENQINDFKVGGEADHSSEGGQVERTELMMEPSEEYLGADDTTGVQMNDQNSGSNYPDSINSDSSVFGDEGSSGDLVDPSDISDIADFANSNSVEADSSDLRINIFVSGLDTKNIKDAIKEELLDKKLNVDIETMLNKVVDGNLKIENLSPLKASIIVERLNNYSLSIRWEQYALSVT